MAEEGLFIRVREDMPDHPKVIGLSDKAFRHLIETWCWCAKNLTDGHVVNAAWTKRVPKKVRDELIAAGHAEVVAGGVLMHDYLDHQRSRAQVEELRAKRAKAGSKGGNRKAANAKQGASKPLASATDGAKQPASKNVAEIEIEKEELETSSSSQREGPRKRGCRLPDDWKPSTALVSWARSESIPDELSKRETEKFHDYWAGQPGQKGVKTDWDGTWRNWMRKAQEYARPGPPVADARRDNRQWQTTEEPKL